MKKKLLTLAIGILILNSSLNAQYCTNTARFTETEVFTNSQITSSLNVQYGTAVDHMGVTQNLVFDIYFPKLNVDPLPKRPLIYLIHGGGFAHNDKTDFTEECKMFAKRGFVAVTIDYRLGVKCITDPLAYNKAVYRALQDANAGLRYVVANAAALKIDTSWIFVGGQSAGSATALGMVYTSQADIDTFFPTFQTQLGLLANSSNTLTNQYSIKGIYNNWGGEAILFVKNDKMLPMVSFHGDADLTVNIDSALDSSCPTNTITLDVYGSRALHNLSLTKGVCSGLTVQIGGDHGIYNGTLAEKNFRVSRTACFFKSMFCNTCSSYYSIDSTNYPCSTTTVIDKNNMINYATNIFPNPTHNLVNISGSKDVNGLEIEVINIYGKCIMISKGVNTVDLSEYSPGIYLVKIKDGFITSNHRLIKQ